MRRINITLQPMKLDNFLSSLNALMDSPQPASGSNRHVHATIVGDGKMVYSITYTKNAAFLFRYETQVTETPANKEPVYATFYNTHFYFADEEAMRMGESYYGLDDLGYGDIGPFRKDEGNPQRADQTETVDTSVDYDLRIRFHNYVLEPANGLTTTFELDVEDQSLVHAMGVIWKELSPHARHRNPVENVRSALTTLFAKVSKGLWVKAISESRLVEVVVFRRTAGQPMKIRAAYAQGGYISYFAFILED